MKKNTSKMRPAPDATGFVDCLRKTVKLRGESFGRASLSIGAAYSALAQYGSNRFYRPTPEILAGIATHWPKDQSIPLITAHLQDEIKRATLDPAQFTIAYYVSTLAKSSDIQAIERAAEGSPGWSALLSALASLAKSDAQKGFPAGAAVSAELSRVAESPPPPYKGKSKRKGVT